MGRNQVLKLRLPRKEGIPFGKKPWEPGEKRGGSRKSKGTILSLGARKWRI